MPAVLGVGVGVGLEAAAWLLYDGAPEACDEEAGTAALATGLGGAARRTDPPPWKPTMSAECARGISGDPGQLVVAEHQSDAGVHVVAGIKAGKQTADADLLLGEGFNEAFDLGHAQLEAQVQVALAIVCHAVVEPVLVFTVPSIYSAHTKVVQQELTAVQSIMSSGKQTACLLALMLSGKLICQAMLCC